MADPVYPVRIALTTTAQKVALTREQCPRGFLLYPDPANGGRLYWGGPAVTAATGAAVPTGGGYLFTVERFEHAGNAVYVVGDAASGDYAYADPQ